MDVLERAVKKFTTTNSSTSGSTSHSIPTNGRPSPVVPAHVVLVSGQPGVGKTTLLREACSTIFWKTIVCRGHCSNGGGGGNNNNNSIDLPAPPLQPIIHILNELVHKISSMVGPGSIVGNNNNRTVWKGRLQEALGGEGPLLAMFVPRLATLMELPSANQRVVKPPPQLQPVGSPSVVPKKYPPTKDEADIDSTTDDKNSNHKRDNSNNINSKNNDDSSHRKKVLPAAQQHPPPPQSPSTRSAMSSSGGNSKHSSSVPQSPSKMSSGVGQHQGGPTTSANTPNAIMPSPTSWDWNTPQRFVRLTLAIRDLIQVVAQYHPLVLVINNIQYADTHTWAILRSLFGLQQQKQHQEGYGDADDEEDGIDGGSSSRCYLPTLKNVLLVGSYDTVTNVAGRDDDGGDDDVDAPDTGTGNDGTPQCIVDFERMLQPPSQHNDTNENSDNVDSNEPKDDETSLKQVSSTTQSSNILTKLSVTPFSLEEVEELLCSIFLNTDEEDTGGGNGAGTDDVESLERIQDLAEILHKCTGGNMLYMIHVLRWLNDEKLVTRHQDGTSKWCWNRKAIKKHVKACNEKGDKVFCGGLHGVLERRMEELPKKVQFVLLATAALHHQHTSSFSGPPASITDSNHLYRIISAGYVKKSKDKEMVCPITSLDEFNSMMLKACAMGLIKRVGVNKEGPTTTYSFAFVHYVVRDSAYRLFVSQKDGTTPPHHQQSSNRPRSRKVSQIHARMGTELSAMATNMTDGSIQLLKYRYNMKEREEFKFLAADQLILSKDVMWEDRGSVLKLLVETAELCFAKSCFATSVHYLEIGIDFMSSPDPTKVTTTKVSKGMRASLSDTWNSSDENYDILVRAHVLLAKMRLAMGDLDGSKMACDELFEHARTLKDRVPASRVYVQILLSEGGHKEALNRVLTVLEQLGESFPTGGGVSDTVTRELANLRRIVKSMDNERLLTPPRMTDKKTMDIMELLADLVEVCRFHDKKKNIQELAVIRMMHLSLKFGFTRQYPMAFAYFGTSLIQRAVSSKNSLMVKDAHRMGQISEKIARLGDFYGGNSVALFHWHISHWKRLYKRTLEPVLRIYNAQLDAGDFCHVDFSIFTYIQYHLASGYDLAKLDDNLQLFDGLFYDYNLPNAWKVSLPQQMVANLLGESSDPYLFLGDTVDEQEVAIREMQESGMTAALQYMNFLRLYVAIFFHNYDLADQCLDLLTEEIEGVWIPWILFFQCLVETTRLSKTTNKGARKQVKDTIDEIKGKLIDWYNDGAPNPSAMISLIEAELAMASNVGRRDLPAIRIQKLFDEAISSAQKDEMKHLEALAYERAAIHFKAAQIPGFCSEYIGHAYRCYDQWNALAKVIDVEEKFGKYLKPSHRSERAATSNVALRKQEPQQQSPQKSIGGGRHEIKPFSIRKAVQKVGLFGKARTKGNRQGNNKANLEPIGDVRPVNDDDDVDQQEEVRKMPQKAPPMSPSAERPANLSSTKSMEAVGAKTTSPGGNVSVSKKGNGTHSEGNSIEATRKSDNVSSVDSLTSSRKGTLFSPRTAKPKMKLPFS